MSDTYTKLFSSITESTIVSEPVATRWLWVTMLAMANANGEVFGSVPGLARRANISVDDTERALATFYAPDPHSRTKEHEGRRIEEIDGGWRLLNHAKYAAVRNKEERTEYMREYMRNYRGKQESVNTSVNTGKQKLAELAELAPLAPALDKSKEQEHVPQAARFADFWSVYPIKRAKKAAESKWKQKRLDAKADELIADVKRRVRDDQQWRDGFAPHAATYLHQERWTDELAGRKRPSVPSTPSPSSHLPAAIERMTPEEREARRKAGEENIKKIEAMLPAMRVNA